jgi:hypothetical protein
MTRREAMAAIKMEITLGRPSQNDGSKGTSKGWPFLRIYILITNLLV